MPKLQWTPRATGPAGPVVTRALSTPKAGYEDPQVALDLLAQGYRLARVSELTGYVEAELTARARAAGIAFASDTAPGLASKRTVPAGDVMGS